MAVEREIQRVPAGLAKILNLFGGVAPNELAPQIMGVLDVLQCYGLAQRQVSVVSNAALAVAGSVSITPSSSAWSVVFAAAGDVIQTATMTAWALSVTVARDGVNGVAVASRDGAPFGATTAGGRDVPFVPPVPLLLPPGGKVSAQLNALGTDATAFVSLTLEFGVFG